MIIKEIATWELGKVVFSRDQSTITLVTELGFHMYGLDGEQICEDELISSYEQQLHSHWVDGESLLFAVYSVANEELMVDIRKIHLTSAPLLHVVESFIVPYHHGSFHFCPVSSHAAFVSWSKVLILNVRSLEVLYQIETAKGYTSPGLFSPDGHFFACSTTGGGICIWENTSTGYVPQSNLRARLLWNKFSWSPTSNSILCWGDNGIQLLHQNSSLSITSLNYVGYPHLVAYTADQTHIATVRQFESAVTSLSLSDLTQQTVNTNIQIQDIKIIDNTIFVTNGKRLISRHLMTGEQVDSSCDTKRENKIFNVHTGRHLVLSNDCSQLAFAIKQTVFLYDIKAQKVLGDLVTDGHVSHIHFSSDGSQLWCIVQDVFDIETFKCYHAQLEREKDPCFVNVTMENLEGEWSLDSLFRSPHECKIVGKESEWVSDPRGNILWLPPNWRTGQGWFARWDGKILTLLDGHHQKPIIIEFQL